MLKNWIMLFVPIASLLGSQAWAGAILAEALITKTGSERQQRVLIMAEGEVVAFRGATSNVLAVLTPVTVDRLRQVIDGMPPGQLGPARPLDPRTHACRAGETIEYRVMRSRDEQVVLGRIADCQEQWLENKLVWRLKSTLDGLFALDSVNRNEQPDLL